MPTKAEILEKYRQIHDNLTKQYYMDKILDKATFEIQHAKCWQDMNAELLAYGFLKQQWTYIFGASMGGAETTIKITSPSQLTKTQIQEKASLLRNANWNLLQEMEELVEA